MTSLIRTTAPRLRHAFGTPRVVLVAHELAEVRPLLDAVQAAAQQGCWCVGYLRYEAAPAFDAVLRTHEAGGPLAWFAVHDDALPWPEDASASTARVEWAQTCPRPVFDAAMEYIQRAIATGELYQVNFTAPLAGAWLGGPQEGAAQALFFALQRAQPGGYAACIDTGDEQLLSVSPELFFDWRAGHILTRPMKGTAPRGVYYDAIGVMQPGGAATFNVLIRTVILRGTEARCGIGSGITSGAQAGAEWQEWCHKSAFVERASMPFEILETLALEAGELRHRTAHLHRMAAAAAHFCTSWDAVPAHECLHALAQVHPQGLWHVRLLLDASGRFSAQPYAMEASLPQVRLQLADRPLTQAYGEFVRFKTTHRAHYDAFTPTAPGVFDSVLFNEQDELPDARAATWPCCWTAAGSRRRCRVACCPAWAGRWRCVKVGWLRP